MGMLLTSEKDQKEFMKHYDIDHDDRLILEYDFAKIFNKKIDYSFWLVLAKNDIIRFDNILTPYLGLQNDIRNIDPYTYSIYRIGRRAYYHKAKQREPLDFSKIPVRKKERDTSELLDVGIKESDNELLVITKELLKGMTTDSFKQLFTSVSDYNNIKREIVEGNGQMTWNRFKLLLYLLGFEYNLSVTKKPELQQDTLKPIVITVEKKKV